MVRAAEALVIAYVLGSIPFAYIAGRLLRGVDLRSIGSGNLGATNVYREIGLVPAILVLICDAAKGWGAVALAQTARYDGVSSWVVVASGACAVLGHAVPVFLLGRGGGKGVATAAGVFAALSPLAVAWSLGVFIVVVATSRLVSAASVIAAAALPVAVGLVNGVRTPVFHAALVVGVFVIWKHRTNMRRIISGAEPRIGRPGKSGNMERR